MWAMSEIDRVAGAESTKPRNVRRGFEDSAPATPLRPLNILHSVDNFSGGGAAVGVLNLARASAERLKHGVLSLTPAVGLAEQLPAGTPVMALPSSRQRLFGFVKRLAAWVRQEGFDVLHVNNPGAWLDVALGARLSGRPCVQTFHGLECSVDEVPAVQRWKCALAARMTTRVIAVGEASRATVCRLARLSSSAVQVIPNGIDLRRFGPASGLQSALVRDELRIDAVAPLAIHVAGLRPVKDQLTLLHAWRLVLASRSQAPPGNARPGGSASPAPVLLLVGDGPCREELISAVRGLGIQDQVRFLGERSDVEVLLPACDVFVLSSRTEGLSLAILEAMACGLPVVATSVGGNPELVRDGETGRLTPARDAERLAQALADVLSNPALARRMGAAARGFVETRHNLETMGDQYVALYSAIVKKQRQSRKRKRRAALECT